jgi:hypothetical protein
MTRFGLPTQDVINAWDDGQRARGYEMVRVKSAFLLRLEQSGYRIVSGYADDTGYWAQALANGKPVAISQPYISEDGLEQAYRELCGELGLELP